MWRNELVIICMKNFYEVKQNNIFKSYLIVILFFIFSFIVIYVLTKAYGMYMGYEIGGSGFIGIALIFSGVSTFISYYFSDRIVLSLSRAKPANKKEHYNFYTSVENLSLSQGMPIPKLYVIEDTAPNAFATGRNYDHSVICATTGLLSKLNRTELEGVLAHELTHIKNYDMLLMSVVSVMVGIIALLGDWLLRSAWFGGRRTNDEDNKGQLGVMIMVLGIVFAILSPIIAQLIQLAISRRREFLADAGSVEITRQPSGLISALQKLYHDREPLEAANKATAHLYIVNPFKDNIKGAVGWFSNLFNTHPPIEKRISALQEML